MTTTQLSRASLQAGRDYLTSPEAQGESYELCTEGEARAIHAAREAELALRGNHQYIQLPEVANLPFRVLHQPRGIPESHVQAMQDNPEQYPGLEVYLAAYYNDGFVGNYVKNDKVPQIIQYRLTAENLRRVITDITEADRIEQEVQAGGQYPLMSLPNPRACQDYARYIGKRLPRDNAESNQLLEALPGYANGEKLTNAGIPIPGIFDADTVHVVSDGRGTNWVTTDRYGSGFVALGLGRFFRVAHDRRIDFNGSSPILLEDIVPA